MLLEVSCYSTCAYTYVLTWSDCECAGPAGQFPCNSMLQPLHATVVCAHQCHHGSWTATALAGCCRHHCTDPRAKQDSLQCSDCSLRPLLCLARVLGTSLRVEAAAAAGREELWRSSTSLAEAAWSSSPAFAAHGRGAHSSRHDGLQHGSNILGASFILGGRLGSPRFH